MLNIKGQVYVTNLKEISPRLVAGDVYCHEMIKEGEFNTTFLKAVFVGDALLHLIKEKVKNKDKIFIDSSVLRDKKYTKNGKEYSSLQLTVFKISSINNSQNTTNTSRFER